MQTNEHTEYTVIRARGRVFVIRFGEQGITVDELSADMSELLDTPLHATWEDMGVLPKDNEGEQHD
jgi:hypothetical protein